MFLLNNYFLVDSLLIFFLALFIDLVFGEFPDRVHPTLWMGKIIKKLKFKLKSKNFKIEKINGVFLCLLMVSLVAVPAYYILFWIHELFGWLPYIVSSAILFQSTFAIKCMKQYTLPVADAVEKEDYDRAKHLLPFIVRRNPSKLDKEQIISAVVETIAEGTTDGITSPLFYYALFGVPGAFAFRVVNTLDSMVGYKDQENINIGWFSARIDTILNYIPARLTAIFMILATMLLKENWRNSWKILKRDRKKMASPNAGWTISTMAGALNIQLEKSAFYVIGDKNKPIPANIKRALRIMLMTTALFGIWIIIPILILKAQISLF